MLLESFEIDEMYLIRTSETSDGTQDKFFKDDMWFKLDRYGGEGIAETVASIILKHSGLDSDEFVEYYPCLINGKQGCYSKNFLSKNDSFITLYRLYKNVTGKDLAAVTARMDFDDAIEYVLNFVKTQTNLDLHKYIANNLALDRIILNDDRHFNNLGVLFNESEFLPAPIFDNGKSFLIGNKNATNKTKLEEKIACSYSKCFNPSYEINLKYLKSWVTLQVPKNIISLVEKYATKEMIEILEITLQNQ